METKHVIEIMAFVSRGRMLAALFLDTSLAKPSAQVRIHTFWVSIDFVSFKKNLHHRILETQNALLCKGPAV
jgi:hypothetical protein